MKKLIGRKDDLKKLKQGYLLGANVFIHGPKGTGKTSLVSTFESGEDKTLFWIVADEKRSIDEVIVTEIEIYQDKKVEYRSFESLIRQLKIHLKKFDSIVWDNFHLIPEVYQSLILEMISSPSEKNHHIIISASNFKNEIEYSDLKTIHLSNFSHDEMVLFFKEFECDYDESSLYDIYNKTSGNPYLLNLFILSDGDISSHWKKQYRILNEQEKRFVRFLSLLNRPLKIDQVDADLLNNVSLKSLTSSMLVNKLNGEDEVEVRLRKHDLIVDDKEITENKLWNSSRLDIINFLDKFEDNQFEKLYHLLFTDRVYDVRDLAIEVTRDSLHKLEFKNINFVNKLSEMCESFLISHPLEEITQTTMSRILARCLFLLGKRSKAIGLMKTYRDRFQNLNSYKIQAKLLMLEYAQQLNRYGKYEESLSVVKDFALKTEGSLNAMFQIEQCTALINIQTDQALHLFKKLLSSIEVIDDDSHEYRLAKGELYFQFARCYYNLDKMDESKDMFEKAILQFQTLTKPYFLLVCKLNLGWIYLKKQEYESTNIVIEDALSQSVSFGFNYVSAGLNLVAAKVARHHLEFEESLKKVNLAAHLIGEDAPFEPKKDIMMERVRVLLHLGRRSEASTYLEKLCESKNSNDFKKSIDYKKILFETSIYNLDLVKEVDGWLSFKYDEYEESHRDLYLLQLNQIEDDVDVTPKSKLQKMMFLLGEAHQCLLKKDTGSLWGHMQKLIPMFDFNHDKNEYAAYVKLLLVLSDSALDVDLRDQRLNELKEDIKSFNVDEEIKEVITTTINNIIAPNSSLWKKCTKRDTYRYQLIVEAFTDHSLAKYQCITNDDQYFCNEYIIDKSVDFIFVEELGELYFRGKLITDFIKRKKLRLLLSAFLSVRNKILGRIEIVPIVWGEVYDPLIHDSRVYTSIQRLKSVIGKNDILMNHEGGYSWNPKYSYKLFKKRTLSTKEANTRNETLLYEVFKSFSRKNDPFLSRKTLVQATGLSESQVKRELSSLLEKGLIRKTGSGRSVRYTLI